MLTLPEGYPYFYETHLHTSESSACAISSGAEAARAYKEAGYTGMFVTDHNWGGNTSVDRSLPWKEWVEQFYKGYENAKAEGDKIGLDVFFAWEAGYRGTEFLIYGLDKKWLLEHPEIKQASVEEQFLLVKESGGMVVHAHPYRKEFYIAKIRLYPEWVDGVEGLNAKHINRTDDIEQNKESDAQAIAYARKHGFFMTAGSDMHMVSLLGGGMAFQKKLEGTADFIQAVNEGEDYVLSNGKTWFDRYGKALEI